jgi:DMSO/TMAO reductase YedYZ molybdopterin-dependent catalytic subunit
MERIFRYNARQLFTYPTGLTNCVPNQKTISRRQFLQGLAPFPSIQTAPSEALPFRDYIPNPPQINADYWALFIHGLKSAPLSFSYADLHRFPMHSQACTLVCAAKPTARHMKAHWEGIRLMDLLALAEHPAQTQYANFYAANGYQTSVPVSALENALLAFRLNGQPLSAAQGFPARLIVPGHYAHKMPLWLRRITFSDTPITGYWEQQGYALHGEIEPTTAFFTPQQHHSPLIRLHGAAYAGKHLVTQVRLSLNQADWRHIPIQSHDTFNWAHWSVNWQAPHPGAYHLRVQAQDAVGRWSPIHETTFTYTGGQA